MNTHALHAQALSAKYMADLYDVIETVEWLGLRARRAAPSSAQHEKIESYLVEILGNHSRGGLCRKVGQYLDDGCMDVARTYTAKAVKLLHQALTILAAGPFDRKLFADPAALRQNRPLQVVPKPKRKYTHQPLEERFWSKVDRSGDGCWPWLGYVKRGKGVVVVRQSERRSAQVVAYELTFGVEVDPTLVSSICNNRLCCNPGHIVYEQPMNETLMEELSA